MGSRQKRNSKLLRKQHKDKCRLMVNTLRKNSSCCKCGIRGEVTMLEFHHRDPSTKKDSVSTLVGRRSTGAVIKEISKCDLVCEDCHKRIHKNDKRHR